MSVVSFVYRIEARSGYLLVWQKGCPSIQDLAGMQAALELAAARYRIWRVLFDNRDLDSTSEEVRNFMINWLDQAGRFDAQALLLKSDMIAVRTTMDALAKRVPRRGFCSIEDAEAWLLGRR